IDFMIANGLGASIGGPSEVKVIDEYTVKVIFPTYNMTAARLLANVYIYSKKTYDEKGLDYCDVHPVGTGPFVFKEYVPDGYVSFVRNDNYWQAGKPYLDGVEIKIIADANAAMTAFANKQLDTLSTSDEAIKQQIVGMGYEDVAIVTFDNQSITSFAPNTFVEGDPWSNLKVRQAVMLYGIDPVEVGMLAAGPVAQPNSQFCMPGSLMYNEEVDKTITYDLEKAKKLLAEAGYPNGFKTDAYPTNVNVAVATALQDVFKRLGIEMEIHTIPNGDTRRGDGVTPGIFFCNGKSKYDQLSGLITTVFHTDASQMSRNIKFSAEYEALYNKAMSAETEAERAKLAKELAYKLHIEECLSRVIYTKMGSVYIQDNIHDEQITYTNPDYVNLWKSK
ncbi:MAG: ABC transporter substrate-binding protein, partial [Clostridia bacterium]|nr:ABC transporter substrate-binding protein [Clostridia bacterium]